MDARKFAADYLIFKCITGSKAYGFANEDSDTDERGVFIAPPESILSCYSTVDQVEDNKNDDVVFELRKYIKLASENNPNIIELLYADEEFIKYIDWPFKLLRENRHLFLSKKARYTFSGYSFAQLKRIKGHHKWINRPASVEPPVLYDYCKFIGLNGEIFNAPEHIRELEKDRFLAMTFGKHQFRVYQFTDENTKQKFQSKLGFFNNSKNDVSYIDISQDKLNQLNAAYLGFLIINFDDFSRDINHWKGYWEWKKNRNPKRAALEEKAGYDLKHACHLYRLMCMCKEILKDGTVLVKRPDADFLRRIRNGEFDYNWLIKFAEDTELELEELYQKSPLQHSSDKAKIDELYREIVVEYWKEKKLL